MYNTDFIEGDDRYCLYSYTVDSESKNLRITHHHLIKYCIRIDLIAYIKGEASKDQKSISFSDLKDKNVSVNELFKFSTSIDTLERYQMYLMNITTRDNADHIQRFYNCTRPLFGHLCLFKFDIESSSFAHNIWYAIQPPFDPGSSHTSDPVSLNMSAH
ncbi:hypothetical protein I4U23_017013 [Adineta vaga]|nr:hypothetical protein I4U23_017013 [Adineta vaga]